MRGGSEVNIHTRMCTHVHTLAFAPTHAHTQAGGVTRSRKGQVRVAKLFKVRVAKLINFTLISIMDRQNPSSEVKCLTLHRHPCQYKLFAFVTLAEFFGHGDPFGGDPFFGNRFELQMEMACH